MQKSTFTPLYARFREKLVELRQKAGLTQRALAKRLGREPSFVSRIELAERRLDVVEAYWVLIALQVDPAKTMHDLMLELRAIDARSTPPAKGNTRTRRAQGRR